jgi:serine protease inhibitor
MQRLRQGAALCAAVVSAAAVGGCAARPHAPAKPGSHTIRLTSSQVATLRSLGAGDTAFGLNLLSVLCRSQPGANVLISPYSVATGLSMAYLGARGDTATAMARVLHLPAAGASLIAGLRARRALLASLNRPGVAFAESNRLWADPSLVTNRSYRAALQASYRAGVTHVPLLSAPDRARAAINSAVAAETRGHIRDLLPAGSIPPGSTGWVLTNALYLNAAWRHRFDRASTAPGPFRTGNGTVVTARYMHGSGYGFAATASGWAATTLRYRGGRLAMLALLPPAGSAGRPGGGGPCQVPTVKELRTLIRGLGGSGGDHEIALPKVKLASSEPLKGALTRLGMRLAFSGQADFTGISPQAWRLGFVQHAATMSVDEKGTVATAATAAGIQPSALPLPLIFDRPYLLVIRDMLTGEPLMMAWVANPAEP